MKFFKLKTLELDLEKRLLTINGKSVSTDDITDFSLSTRDDGSWSITAKKNLLMEFFEECPKKNSEGKPTPGNRVRVLREQAGMTQAELGKLLNVRDAAISKYESGKIPLTGDTLLLLSQIFNISIDYILGNDGFLAASETENNKRYS